VTTTYNPTIRFGSSVKVETDLASNNASGVWSVNVLVHTLEAEIPGGAWQTRFFASIAGNPTPQVRTSAP
jgi:hypothetical protein